MASRRQSTRAMHTADKIIDSIDGLPKEIRVAHRKDFIHEKDIGMHDLARR